MKNKYNLLLLIVVLGTILISCGSNSTDSPTPVIEKSSDYTATVIPNDVTKLYLEKGNKNSNNAILFTQGGPSATLKSVDLEDLGLSDNHLIYVHQANTYNKNIIEDISRELTLEQAKLENDVSIEMLYKVAKHFIDRGKKVYIVGHSFGAFIIPYFIYKKDLAVTKYLILAGRMDMNDIVWEGFRDKKYYTFVNGLTPTRAFFPPEATEKLKTEKYNSGKLQAVVAMNRFTELLKDKTLSNVIYAYGTKDEAVGSLTVREENFLKSKGVDVYKIEGGGHSSMFETMHKEALKAKLLATN